MLQQIANKLGTASRVIRVVWRDVLRYLSLLSSRREFVQDLLWFVNEQDPIFRRRLLIGMDPGRVVALAAFRRFLQSIEVAPKRVAVISGSISEPELHLMGEAIEVDFLNFSERPDLFDLQRDWSKPEWKNFVATYDFVLCEQVLEHLIDPKLAVENLSLLLRPGGTLHLSVPSVNNRHGEPTYFYAGFAAEALEFWVGSAGLEVSESSSFFSDKGSRMYATTDWAPLAESGPPIFFVGALRTLLMEPGPLVALVVRKVKHLVRYPFQPLFPARPTRNAVVSWIIARKPDKR